MKDYITVIGGGLAGCEAAYQIAKEGIKVKLYEMKPNKYTPAHSNKDLAEIVCSNSFKSNLLTNACGLLKEELRKLFKVYGQVKNLRLPTKIDGSHRGFAFIEFMSHEEAQKAFKELQNTHFYGRKIIIEWAKQDNSIEGIREKTSKKANAINIKTHDTKMKGTTYL